MITTTHSRIVVTVALILALMSGCASTRTQESTGQYFDDTVITTKVKAAIFGDSDLKSGEINVETFKGVVQLSGFASSADARARASTVAQAVDGVKSVKNDIQVK